VSRRVLGLDRFLALLLGLVLVALGAAVGAWGLGQLTRVWPSAPGQVSTGPVTNALGASWWAGAAAAGAVVLGLLGLWWLLAHIPRRSTGGPLRLSGSDRSGALSVDGSAAAQTAAEVLAETPGVRSASGKVVSDRGQLVAEISVTAEPSVDLTELAEAVERTTADLNTVLGRSDLRGRVAVHIARRERSQPRVR
jgi:hypothetical protein